MAIKIFFGNYKGGVGKTTSAFYIAHYFSKNSFGSEKKVLILDLDPQCSMSEICMRSFGNKALDDLPQEQTLNYMLDILSKSNKYSAPVKFNLKNTIKICTDMSPNVDFIPTTLTYSGKDNTFIGLDGLIDDLQLNPDKNIFLLYEIVRMLENDYDFIFFDCPPSNNILTKSAFLLSDYYIIPYISDGISIKGVDHYIFTVTNIYDKYCERHIDANFYKHIFGSRAKLLGLFECMRVRNENPRGNIGAINAKKYDVVVKNLIGIQENLSRGRISEETGAYERLSKQIAEDIIKDIGDDSESISN